MELHQWKLGHYCDNNAFTHITIMYRTLWDYISCVSSLFQSKHQTGINVQQQIYTPLFWHHVVLAKCRFRSTNISIPIPVKLQILCSDIVIGIIVINAIHSFSIPIYLESRISSYKTNLWTLIMIFWDFQMLLHIRVLALVT